MRRLLSLVSLLLIASALVRRGAASASMAVWLKAPKIYQYGKERTATTLQWMIVNAYVCALGSSAAVRKVHRVEQAISQAQMGVPLFVTHESTYDPATFQPGGWRKTAEMLEHEWKIPKGAIVYVQETATVALMDWRIVVNYADAFGISQTSTTAHEVVEFMRLWDILRRCCGPQMSEDYRKRLYGNVPQVNITHFAPMHRGPGDVNYDACETHDIGAVERAMTNATLFKRCGKRLRLQSGVSWANMDGSFCLRYAAAAMKKKSKFNENPFD